MTYDPGFTNTAACKSRITFIDGDKGILNYRGYPIEQLAEKSTFLETAYLLLQGELPTARGAGGLGLRRHPPHDGPREHQGARVRVPLRRAPDGRAHVHGGRPLDLLSRGQAHPRRAGAAEADLPAHREDADPGRARPPALDGPALRLPGQRPQLRRQLPPDDVPGDRAQLQGASRAGAGARGPLHPARRPRAELLDQRHAVGGVVGRRPVFGHRGRHRRPLRPAARRGQRAGAADAGGDRVQGQDPRSSSRK